MNKKEHLNIQKWIDSMQVEIKRQENAQKFYCHDQELVNYFLGKQDAYRDAIYALKFFLNIE